MIEYRTIYLQDRASWRAWLNTNHRESKGVWLKFYRNSTGKPSLRYEESLSEALCYGWIDSLMRKLDDEAYAQKYTPRAPESKWSEPNLHRVEELRKQGLMTAAGEAAIGAWHTRTRGCSDPKGGVRAKAKSNARENDIPPFLARALKSQPPALANFHALAPGYRRMYLKWILAARKGETRLKRAAEAADRLQKNLKLGLK
jgi:uncharacterized protein YdeI (YjbR/CyaY-like superfamily)